MGQNTTINSLTINDPAAVSIGGANTLTISGSNGTPGITVNSGAGLLTISSNLFLSGSSGTISVNNTAGAVISGSLVGTVGLVKTGTGTLTLTGSNPYPGISPVATVSAGTLAVAGASASLGTSFSNIDVGYNNGDNGTLVISNGASVNSSSTYLGFNSGAVGAATVTGAASTLTTNGVLHVGDQGQGSLTISNGGQVNSGGILYSGGGGVAIDSGASIGFKPRLGRHGDRHRRQQRCRASTWSIGTVNLSVGVDGSGTLSILNGGVVSDNQGAIGINQDATGNVVVSGVDPVSHKASTWNNSGALLVSVGSPGPPPDRQLR